MATDSSILAWRSLWAMVHGVSKSRKRPSEFHFTTRSQIKPYGYEKAGGRSSGST